MVLQQVPVDIETTGFDVDETVTVVGFAVPLGCRVFVHDPDGDCDDGELETAVQDYVEKHVQVSTHASESALFQAVAGFVNERLRDEDVLLVAYNGERWRGGFDLPFLRTRAATLGVEWPLSGVPFADLYPVVTRRFNTTVEGDEQSDLPGVYAVLCDGGLNKTDPFADSGEAVEAFADGRLVDLVVHNVVDVLRTQAVGRAAERYCGKSEFTVKSLTPTEYG
jgi:uncharacterized protein YprB with RNaseH-like and TPR domain